MLGQQHWKQLQSLWQAHLSVLRAFWVPLPMCKVFYYFVCMRCLTFSFLDACHDVSFILAISCCSFCTGDPATISRSSVCGGCSIGLLADFFTLWNMNQGALVAYMFKLPKLTWFISRLPGPCCTWLGSIFIHVERVLILESTFLSGHRWGGAGYNGTVPFFSSST